MFCGRNRDLLFLGGAVALMGALTAGSIIQRVYFEEVACEIVDVRIQRGNFDHFSVETRIIYLDAVVPIEYHVDCGCGDYTCQNDCFAEDHKTLKRRIGEETVCRQHHPVLSKIYRQQHWVLAENQQPVGVRLIALYVFTGLFVLLWNALFVTRCCSRDRCCSVARQSQPEIAV